MDTLKVPELPELPETSRTGTPGFPELPAPPIGGGGNGKRERGSGGGSAKPKASQTGRRAKASASRQPPARQPGKSKGWLLESPPLAPGQTDDRFMAQVASDGIVGNARSVVAFGEATFGELSLTDCARVLKDTAQGLNDGDLTAAVTMLSSQAVALNTMFGELARRSALNMGDYLDATERYMRLALKAQGQCRATLETLAAIKNPPVVFARQANINNGGQQQVNNGARPGLAAAGGGRGVQELSAPAAGNGLQSHAENFSPREAEFTGPK